jgi:hypothetical protein
VNLDELLHDAVDDVEPADRLDAIRARTSSPAQAARPWWWAAGGVVVATAVAVTVFAVAGDRPESSGPAGHHHGASDAQTMLVAAYFVGDSPSGPRLFREFDEVPSGDPLQAALERIQRPPGDPDYRASWPHGSFETARVADGTIDVEVGDVDLDLGTDGLVTQQVVYTLQAAVGERLPVRFVQDGEVVRGPVDAAPQLDVLNLVSISDPAEGTAYVGRDASFVARGRASSFEATVPWEVRDEAGKVVLSGFATASGWQGRLHPWETSVDVSDLPSGFYTFVAMTASGAEESLVSTDTRTIIVR